MTPYETNVTSAKTLSTLRNPMTVARPTSSRLRAILEYTLAPSMPRKTNTVISIVPVVWSHNDENEYSSPPQKFPVKTSALNAMAAMTMKTRMGTTLATVTM